MANKFRLNKKNSAVIIDESTESEPQTAAFDILRMPYALKGIMVRREEMQLKPIDETTFLVFFAGDEYVLSKIDGY